MARISERIFVLIVGRIFAVIAIAIAIAIGRTKRNVYRVLLHILIGEAHIPWRIWNGQKSMRRRSIKGMWQLELRLPLANRCHRRPLRITCEMQVSFSGWMMETLYRSDGSPLKRILILKRVCFLSFYWQRKGLHQIFPKEVSIPSILSVLLPFCCLSLLSLIEQHLAWNVLDVCMMMRRNINVCICVGAGVSVGVSVCVYMKLSKYLKSKVALMKKVFIKIVYNDYYGKMLDKMIKKKAKWSPFTVRPAFASH